MINTEIFFSQVREDPELDLLVFDSVAGNDKNALIIGSGGCSMFSLLMSDNLDSLDVIDSNYAQIQLIKLKIEAFRQLDTESYINFIEHYGSHYSFTQKIDTFNFIKSNSDLDLSYWNNKNRLLEIGYGVNQTGIFEQIFKNLRDFLNRDVINNDSKKIFDFIFDRNYLRDVFGFAAVDYSMHKEFSDHFFEVTKKALSNYSNNNYFIDQMLEGKYNDFLPIYLNKYNKEKIVKNLSKISFIHAPFNKYIKNNPQKYNFIHTSNISDWLPTDVLLNFFKNISLCLKSDGKCISRRLNGDHSLNKVISEYMLSNSYCLRKSDVSYNTRFSSNDNIHLKDNDKSFFYSEVIVGSKLNDK
ncbi:S-adenosylmethionine--diacylglycerol 3-amino-3-carboxypropyl transferase [Francisella halioticida]|uniref:DUF3419 family protein n=1 Tax=Francisella halioticida TaxID=549298 RepID=UPI001AF2E109|nr:DUF3419 family protein [Francisella halioticida]BCD92272.1 S-adenosylmethionine--diacylglycerol 3-amino-3-carboxypropyl transferase [Francisella halioticida]